MAALINLLPDVRQAKIKSSRRRQVASALTVSIIAGSLALVVIAISATVAQRVRINQLHDQIGKKQSQIEGTKDIKTILTVQEHLATLPKLYGNRVYITKLLGIVQTFAPAELGLDSVTVDEQNQLKMSGRSRNLLTLARFSKALEGSNVTVGPGAKAENSHYFTDIAVQSSSIGADGKVTFSMLAQVGAGAISNGQ